MANTDFEFGMQELYSCCIKATSKMRVNDIDIEPNETVAAFDKIMLSTFDDTVRLWTAHGGYHDRDHVFWETTKDIKLSFTQGIFSKVQLALMTNRKLVKINEDDPIYINNREELESDEEGIVTLSYEPVDYLFLYDKKTGKRIDFEAVSMKSAKVDAPYKDIIADYLFQYNNGATRLIIGQSLSNGFFTFEGKTRVKDDISGQTHTGIIYIPKLKLVSDISMRLGREATPQVGRLDAFACPVGTRGNTRVMEFTFLNDDIDTDI